MNKKYIKRGAIIIAIIMAVGGACLFIFSDGTNWPADEVDASYAKGDEIAIALEKYYAKFNYYPNNLDELVPEYIDRIENPSVGYQSWFYDTYGPYPHNSAYQLSFTGPEDRDVICIHDSDAAVSKWFCIPKT